MGNRFATTIRRMATALIVAGIGLAGSASATLLDRGPDMVYDDVLNITWTRNANLPGNTGLTWGQANAWAASLVVDGVSGWRLPYVSVSAGAGPAGAVINHDIPNGGICTGRGGADEVACRNDELGYMYYYDLGADPYHNVNVDKTGNQTALGGQEIAGIQILQYWSGTMCDSFGDVYWFYFGGNGTPESCYSPAALNPSGNPYAAWAVHDGDVGSAPAAAPEPASLLLIGLGLAGLGFSRKRAG